ncbi:methyltransferase domain-containing protein [Streptomyces capparidis]
MSTRPQTPRDHAHHDAPDGVPPLAALLDAAEAAPGAATPRARSLDLLGLPPGARAVDAGCGTGLAAAELAARGVRVTGVDADPRMTALAARRHPGVRFLTGDARALPFADGGLDGYRAERLLHDLADPAAAVAEARRVLRPGGRIVLLGQDWDAMVVDADDAEPTRTIVRARADAVACPRAARAHRRLLLDAGFGQVVTEARVELFTDPAPALPMLAGLAKAAADAGAVTRARAGAWLDDQRARARRGALLVAVPVFVAAGRKEM